MSRRKIDRKKQYPSFQSFGFPLDLDEEAWDDAALDDEQPICFGGVITKAMVNIKAHFDRYMDAHHFLPFDYFFTGTAEETEAVMCAAAMLTDPQTTEDEAIAAIVLLGHSPCQAALNALGRFASGAHPLAGIADLALEECLQLGDPKSLVIA